MSSRPFWAVQLTALFPLTEHRCFGFSIDN